LLSSKNNKKKKERKKNVKPEDFISVYIDIPRHFKYFSLFDKGSLSVVQADLQFEILLPQPLKCWDYKP
jgi:hypothetical protein